MKHYTNSKGFYIFSPWLRIFHWVMVLCVITLFFTGLYIGNPGFGALPGREPTELVTNIFAMEMVRKIHFVAAFLLIASVVLRLYGALRNRGDRLLPKFWHKGYWEGLFWGIKHYLFLPSEHRFYLRNSLARTAYAGVYVVLAILGITGIAMYIQIYPTSLVAKVFNPFNLVFTEYITHYIHHLCAWFMMIFMVMHVYLAFRADLTEHNGEISAMFSGVKYYTVEPYDLDDIMLDKERAREIRSEREQQRKAYAEAHRKPKSVKACPAKSAPAKDQLPV